MSPLRAGPPARWAAGLLALVGLAAIGWAGAAPASAAEADSMTVRAALTADGLVTVSSTWTFATPPDSLSQTFALVTDQGDGRDHHRALSGLSALTPDGTALAVTTATAGGVETVTVTPAGAPVVTLDYTVRGATWSTPDGALRVEWDVLQGLSVGVRQMTGQLDLPAGVQNYICQRGPLTAPQPCDQWQGGVHGSMALSFTNGPQAPGDIVTIGAVLATGTVPATAEFTDHWSLARAFQLGWRRVGPALGVTLVGVILAWGLRRGRRGPGSIRPTVVAGFQPSERGGVAFVVRGGVRPGLVGTLVDHSVDPSDILATLLDLARRGHLRITELPRASGAAVPDWTLTRRLSGDPLDDFERRLLDVVAPPGQPRAVSDLPVALGSTIHHIQDALYHHLVRAGWFRRHPLGRRRRPVWPWVGLLAALAATVALALFTTWALVGLAAVAVAATLVVTAHDPPLLTRRGASVVAGLARLSEELHHSAAALPPGREHEEAATILPYAVVLGGWDRWLGAAGPSAAGPAGDPASSADGVGWYQGPPGWNSQQLPDSLDGFITVTTGRLFTRV